MCLSEWSERPLGRRKCTGIKGELHVSMLGKHTMPTKTVETIFVTVNSNKEVQQNS